MPMIPKELIEARKAAREAVHYDPALRSTGPDPELGYIAAVPKCGATFMRLKITDDPALVTCDGCRALIEKA